jgi:hypothetical protein
MFMAIVRLALMTGFDSTKGFKTELLNVVISVGQSGAKEGRSIAAVIRIVPEVRGWSG